MTLKVDSIGRIDIFKIVNIDKGWRCTLFSFNQHSSCKNWLGIIGGQNCRSSGFLICELIGMPVKHLDMMVQVLYYFNRMSL